MRILDDIHLIRFDRKTRKLVITYVLKEDTAKIETILVSTLSLAELESVSIAEAERKIGRRVIMMFPAVLKALYRGRRQSKRQAKNPR